MKHILLICLPLLFTGCGPLLMPMNPRLDAAQQKTVDGMWDNMLTPTDRLDHDLLLDVVATYSLYQLGVDRLHMTAEKYYKYGKIILEIDCDRVAPDSDQFTITLLDDRGHTVRRERYARREIEARFNPLRGMQLIPVDKDSNPRPLTPEELAIKKAEELRVKRIEAATQPVKG